MKIKSNKKNLKMIKWRRKKLLIKFQKMDRIMKKFNNNNKKKSKKPKFRRHKNNKNRNKSKI